MDMKNYIEEAERRAGTQKKLSEILGITTRYINMAKNKERCLSVDTCIVLADYIKKDRLEVIAASNLATEKDEKKRRILESCFSTAASVTAAALVISVLTLSPTAPASAAFKNEIVDNTNYWQLNRRRRGRRKSDFISYFFDKLQGVFQRDDLNFH